MVIQLGQYRARKRSHFNASTHCVVAAATGGPAASLPVYRIHRAAQAARAECPALPADFALADLSSLYAEATLI